MTNNNEPSWRTKYESIDLENKKAFIQMTGKKAIVSRKGTFSETRYSVTEVE